MLEQLIRLLDVIPEDGVILVPDKEGVLMKTVSLGAVSKQGENPSNEETYGPRLSETGGTPRGRFLVNEDLAPYRRITQKTLYSVS